MLVVDSPFPPYAPIEYFFKGLPAEETDSTNWSKTPEDANDSMGDSATIKTHWSKQTKDSLASTHWVGRTQVFAWKVKGKEHRSDGRPALIEEHNHPSSSDKIPVLSKMSWKTEGLQHREGDLPALVWIGNTEEVESREMNCFAFFKKDLIHRIDDFAYFDNTSKEKEGKEFFLYGVRLTEEEFFSTHADAIEYQIPLWVALYKSLFKLNFDNLKPLEEWDATLYQTLPFDWVCQALNLPDRWNDLGLYSSGSIDDCKAAIARLVQYEKS